MRTQRHHEWTEDPAVTRERERCRRRQAREARRQEQMLRTGEGLEGLFGGRVRIVRVSK